MCQVCFLNHSGHRGWVTLLAVWRVSRRAADGSPRVQSAGAVRGCAGPLRSWGFAARDLPGRIVCEWCFLNHRGHRGHRGLMALLAVWPVSRRAADGSPRVQSAGAVRGCAGPLRSWGFAARDLPGRIVCEWCFLNHRGHRGHRGLMALLAVWPVSRRAADGSPRVQSAGAVRGCSPRVRGTTRTKHAAGTGDRSTAGPCPGGQPPCTPVG